MNKKAKVITISSGKGGVGKSTTASNLAHFFGYKGYKTLIVDLDIGLKTLDLILGFKNIDEEKNLANILLGKINYKDCFLEVPKGKNLYFLNSSNDNDKSILEINKLNKIMEEIKKEFDYIIIDGPSGVENGFVSSYLIADIVILTITPDNFSVIDAQNAISLIEKNSKKDIYFILNKYDDELVKNGYMFDVEQIKKQLGIPLLGIVNYDEYIIKSTDLGVPICFYSKTKGGEEFRNIVKRLLGEDIPLPKVSLFTKLKDLLGF